MGWDVVLSKAVDISLTAAICVFLIRFILRDIKTRVDSIEKDVRDLVEEEHGIFESVRSIEKKRTCCIREGRIYLDKESAQKVIEIGLDRDVSDVLEFFSTNYIWDPPSHISHNVLREQITQHVGKVLNKTRTFFGYFVTDKGVLRAPLDRDLGLSESLQEGQMGDKEFLRLIDTVANIIQSDRGPRAKQSEIRTIVTARRNKTETMMVGWLSGVDAKVA